jgi:hypothetical protein
MAICFRAILHWDLPLHTNMRSMCRSMETYHRPLRKVFGVWLANASSMVLVAFANPC